MKYKENPVFHEVLGGFLRIDKLSSNTVKTRQIPFHFVYYTTKKLCNCTDFDLRRSYTNDRCFSFFEGFF